MPLLSKQFACINMLFLQQCFVLLFSLTLLMVQRKDLNAQFKCLKFYNTVSQFQKCINLHSFYNIGPS